MLTFIDAHTHLCDNKLKDNILEVRNNYLNDNVKVVVDSGCDVKSTKLCLNHAEKYKEIYFVAGIHPENSNDFNIEDLTEIENLAKHKKCIAIGEIGLDYHYQGYDKDKQKLLFVKQLNLANKLNLPVVIHSRDACKETLDILNENKNLLNKGFLMHCYSESAEVAKEIVKLGGYFSFGGAVTFKNSKKIEVVKSIPLDRLLIETDAPYLSPEPLRGRLNEPKNIIYTYDFMARSLNIKLEDFTKIITDNFNRLFM